MTKRRRDIFPFLLIGKNIFLEFSLVVANRKEYYSLLNHLFFIQEEEGND